MHNLGLGGSPLICSVFCFKNLYSTIILSRNFICLLFLSNDSNANPYWCLITKLLLHSAFGHVQRWRGSQLGRQTLHGETRELFKKHASDKTAWHTYSMTSRVVYIPGMCTCTQHCRAETYMAQSASIQWHAFDAMCSGWIPLQGALFQINTNTSTMHRL